MIKNLLIACFLMISMQAVAQTGEITGMIVDSDTQEPLIGATVQVKGTTKGGIADLSGKYLVKGISVGNYVLEVSYVGYDNLEVPIEVTEGQTTQIDPIKLVSNVVGLREVEVFASVVEDRKTPIAISAINSQEIDQRFGGVDLTSVVGNTPGVYAIQGAGGYGDSEVYIRGFDQTNVAFLVNGIPVNDMENGRMFWSNFAGLNEVTRQVQVQRGLGASKLAISSIGGTVNMITKPAQRAEGGKLEYQMGTGSWNQRLRFTYHSGESDNGWAMSFQGSRTTTNSGLVGLSATEQGGVIPGAFTDAWSYYLAISKSINKQHQIMFWGFGAPVDRGTAWIADDATRENFGIQGPAFNNALGYYRGELFNARQNKSHKPLTAITHYWTLNSSSNLTTSLYYSFANVYSTQPRDSESSLFFPTRSITDDQFTSDGLINWDVLAAVNENNATTVLNPNGDAKVESITGNASQYYLESRHNDHKWIGLISNYRKQLANLDLTGGIDLRHYRGLHYAEVFELFGGDFVLNRSPFGDDFNKLNPNGVARLGDRINYDYDGVVNWGAAFAQAEYSKNKINAFGTITYTHSRYHREGNFWNGRDIYNLQSLGKSDVKAFNTYTLKAGFNYRPTNRHSLFVNGGYFNRPPFFRNSFADARFSNEYRQSLTTEKIASFEAGYGYRTSRIKANINGYWLTWADRTTQFEVDNGDFQDLNDDEQIPLALNGLVSDHKGVELDFTFNATSNLELNGFASIGDWKWVEAPPQTVTVGSESRVYDNLSEIIDLPVGAAAQTTAGFGMHYKGIRNMYMGFRGLYADRIPVRYNPEAIVDGFIDREVILDGFPSYTTWSIYMGRYFDLGDKVQGRLSASVQNLFDAEYVRWASYFFNQTQRAFGYPRTYTIGLMLEF